MSRQRYPTPVLLPGISHGWRSLVGYSPWGRTQLDTTEWLHSHFSLSCVGEENGHPFQCSCLENPRDGEPRGLPSMGSHRVGHDWSDLAVAAKPMNEDPMHLEREKQILVKLSVNVLWLPSTHAYPSFHPSSWKHPHYPSRDNPKIWHISSNFAFLGDVGWYPRHHIWMKLLVV